MDTQKRRIVGILITLIGGAFWGLSGACGQYLFLYKEASAKWLVPIRLVVAGYVMLIFFLAKDRQTALRVWKTKKNAFDVIVYGLAGLMLCQYSYFATIELSNAGTATILQYVAPVMIMIAVCIIDKKMPQIMEVIAILCALTGIFLIATHGNLHQLVISKQTLVFGLISAASVVVYNLEPKNLMKQFSTPLLLAWGMTIGGTVLFILFKPWEYSPVIDAETIVALIAIIVFGTIVSFSFYMQGSKLIGPTHASLYACVEPVSATILSSLWLKAPFTMIDFIGFIFIISTIFILTLSSKESKAVIKEKEAA